MNNPLVSAIIPVHNGERFLRAAIDSILQQDYQPLELIVVDDGSTDGTAAIIQSYPAARYVYQINQGHGGAKNTGISAARGEMIAFLDADDVWERDKTRLQVECLLNDPAAEYVTCHMSFLREPGAAWPVWLDPKLVDKPYPAFVPSGLMVRRTAFQNIGLFDSSLWHTNDSDWFLRSRDAGAKGVQLPQALFVRRIHDTNLSHDAPGISKERFRLLHASIKRKTAANPPNESHAR